MSIIDFDSNTWEDAWFQELPPKAKLLFIFLWTNNSKKTTALYEITVRTMAFKTGLTESEIKTSLSSLAPKIEFHGSTSVVFVVNHVRRQYLRTGKISERVVTGINRDLQQFEGHPFKDKFERVYRTSLDCLQRVQGKGEGKGINLNSFERFYLEYPRKQGKAKAQESWSKIQPDEKLLVRMIDTVRAFKESGQWDDPKYIPLPATWLNQERWTDEPTQQKGSSNNAARVRHEAAEDARTRKDRQIAQAERDSMTDSQRRDILNEQKLQLKRELEKGAEGDN